MITTGYFFEEYVTTDNEEYIDVAYVQDLLHDANFTVVVVVVVVVVSIAMLAFVGLFHGRKRPPDSVKPKESKTAYIFINQQKLPYDVDLYATVADLKQKIGDRIGSDVIDNQYLIFAGKRLSDNKILFDYNVQMHSTLFLSERILGGSRQPARFCAGGRHSRGRGRGRGRGRSQGRGRSRDRSPPIEGKANRAAGMSGRVGRENDNQNSTGVGAQQNGGMDNDKSGDRRGGEHVSQKFSEGEVLFYGLIYAGFNEERQKTVDEKKNIERFRCFYGVEHKAVAALIKDLPDKDFQLKNLLLALNYLKTYNTEIVLSGWWGMSEETVRKWTKHYQQEIQKLKEKKIRGLNGLEYDTVFILTVDGVHFRTYESRKRPTAKVYSHKSNGPAMSYEIAIAIHESRVLAINGPFDASKADITIFRDQLKDAMPEGKKGIGDSGYQGEPNKLSFHRQGHSKDMTNFINRVRARHENFNARIKNFNILSNCFRSNDKVKHKRAFEAVCILCQYDMENGHPLMDV